MEVIKALLTVVVGLAVFFAALLGLYALVNLLPRRRQEGGRILVFLLPAMFVLIAGLVVPAIRTTYFSFLSDKQGNPFRGLGNFSEIFRDKNSRTSLTNTFFWVLLGAPVATFVGLMIARFADGMRGEAAAKSIIFLPRALSLAGAGIIWKFVYDGPSQSGSVGLLNAVTKIIPGWPDKWGGDGQRLWLIESGGRANTFLLIVILVWVETGFATVIFSAAIKGVPESLIEAAKVDGATNRQAFFKVTVPYIRATIVTVLTLITISALKVFDIVQATTGGNFRTSTLANDVYTSYFTQQRDGFGSALAVLLFLFVIPIVVINQRSQRRTEEMMKA
jgi:alpha-glucoside transport system permease protein